LGDRTTLADADGALGAVPALGLFGGIALYLLAHVVLRLRIDAGLGRGRPFAALLLLGLLLDRKRRAQRGRWLTHELREVTVPVSESRFSFHFGFRIRSDRADALSANRSWVGAIRSTGVGAAAWSRPRVQQTAERGS
jgi:hypothetical protein